MLVRCLIRVNPRFCEMMKLFKFSTGVVAPSITNRLALQGDRFTSLKFTHFQSYGRRVPEICTTWWDGCRGGPVGRSYLDKSELSHVYQYIGLMDVLYLRGGALDRLFRVNAPLIN